VEAAAAASVQRSCCLLSIFVLLPTSQWAGSPKHLRQLCLERELLESATRSVEPATQAVASQTLMAMAWAERWDSLTRAAAFVVAAVSQALRHGKSFRDVLVYGTLSPQQNLKPLPQNWFLW